LRSTPIVGAFLLVVLILVFEEPERGDADDEIRLNTNSYREDIESLYRIPTYVLVTAGQTSVMFATGALSWWAPTLTEHAWGMLHFTSRVPESVKAE
jgi:hypothetical protein